MKRTHLIAIAIGALLLSSSTIGVAQAGSHKEAKKSHSKEEKGKAIKLKNRSEIQFFDTSTVTSHSDAAGDLSEQNGQQVDHGKHGNHGNHGNHKKQGDPKDSFSGTLPASPPSTSNG